MKTFFILLFVSLLNSASAKTYYFSAVSGDDSRTSIEAQNLSTPWKTLAKLNSFFSSLLPGDFVLLKGGETFYGSIIVNKSGTASAPITISDYGTGNRPVITSLVTLSRWTANSAYSGVYESDANPSFDAKVNIVLLNGTQEPIGRYPNSDLPNKGYLTLESHVSNTSITDNQLPASPNWKGADVVIRTSRWTIDKVLITSHSGSTISHKAKGYEPRDGYGYFIQNHIRTLDQLGEWYYNPSTKKISMYFGGNNPSSYSVQAATNENLVLSASRNYVVFDNITFKGANGNGVYIMGGKNNYISNCDILFSGIDGVQASGTNFKLENSNIVNSNNDGVDVASGLSPLVRNNIVKNSYTIAGMGQSGNGQGAGVRNGGKGLVEYNQIINSGYVGVQLGSDYSVVKNNLIDNFCFIKDDAGGIYASNGPNITNYGRKITGNIVLNAKGAGAGTPIEASSSAEGIYMDDNSNGVEITGNTVANCNRGIFFHNSRDIILKGNTFYNHANSQLFMKHDGLGDPLRKHTITNNIFFSKIATQIVASFTTNVDDIGSIGRLDSNYYARPMEDQITFYNHIYNLVPGQLVNYRDLEGWKLKYGQDDVSRRSAKKIAPYKLKSIVGANKFANEAFNSSVGNIPQGSCVASLSNAGMLDGGYLKIVPSSEGSSIVIFVGTLTFGKNYLLRYSAKGAGTLSLAANLRSASYAPNTPLIKRTIGTSRTENEILFSPTTNESNGALVFKADDKTTYYLDNIQLYEADATITNPDDSIRFVYNASNLNKTVSLNGNYVDVKNKKYSNSIILQPYASAVLIKDDGTETTLPNERPTVTITSPDNSETFASPASIIISATAADADGSISKVDFYSGTKLLGSDSTSPYTFTWNNAAIGNYSLTAKGYDNKGLSTVSPVVAGVISSPISFAFISFSGSSINHQINLSWSTNSSGKPSSFKIESAQDRMALFTEIARVSAQSTLSATVNYTFSDLNPSIGSNYYRIVQVDSFGETVNSEIILISYEPALNIAPTVRIVNPTNNKSYIGPATIVMSAIANDADGKISKVQFYIDTTLMHTEYAAPYIYSWKNVPAGAYLLTAKAYDNSGNVTTSTNIKVSVEIPPTVSIITPNNNISFTGPATFKMEALAADADGTIAKVEFYIGTTLLDVEYESTYTHVWHNVPAGTYILTAKATDNSGNVTTSAGVSISVNNSTPVTGNSVLNPLSNTLSNSTLALAPGIQNSGNYTEPVSVKIGPNPASNIISVFSKGQQKGIKLRISILSISGVELKSINTSTTHRVVQVDISSLVDGIYLIQVMSGGDIVVLKPFVKN